MAKVATGGSVLFILAGLLLAITNPAGGALLEAVSNLELDIKGGVEAEVEPLVLYHTDPTHAPETQQARTIILATQIEFERSTNRFGGPGSSDRLLCAVVKMTNGLVHYAIWMADVSNPEIGTVAVFRDGQWVSAYSGKLRKSFQIGQPKGMATKNIVSCDEVHPPPLAY